MNRPALTPRPSDDKTLLKETGQSRADWFAFIASSGAAGRAAIGKALQAKKLDPWWIGTLTVDYEAHAGIVEKDGRPKGYSICATKSVAAPVGTVYKAVAASRDIVTGTVTKERPDKALVFGWGDAAFAAGSQVEILFQPKGDKTGLVVNHTRVMTRREADEVRALWDRQLTALKTKLEG